MDLLNPTAAKVASALERSVAKPVALFGSRGALMLALALALAVPAGCASLNDSAEGPRAPDPSPREPAAETGEEGPREDEGPREGPLRAYDPGAGTPERAASTRVVRRGLERMREGDAVEAARLLERAIRIDPSNGRAYLRLAQARMMLGEHEEARGLLDRAVAYLRPSPGLRLMAESLRAAIPDSVAARPDTAGERR